MQAALWGPKAWDVLFCAAYRLPPTVTTQLLHDLSFLLPCAHCRRSFAEYAARIDPRTCVAADASDPHTDVAKYIFAVHDLVNLKLDKRAACIPFSTVEARHAVFTAYCSFWDPIDVLALMALTIEDSAEACDAYARTAPALCALCAALGGGRVDVPVLDQHMSPKTAWNHAHAVKNSVRRLCGLPDETREAFKSQYELCRAAQDAPKPKKRASARANGAFNVRFSYKNKRNGTSF